MIGDLTVFNHLVPVLIAVAIVSRGFRIDEDYMASWANYFDLNLTRENRQAVRHNLHWVRRARTAGGLIGFLAPSIYFEVVAPCHDPDDVGGWLGGLLEELGDSVRRLELSRRRSSRCSGTAESKGPIARWVEREQ